MTHIFDFSYSNPTQIVFGPDSVARLDKLVPRTAVMALGVWMVCRFGISGFLMTLFSMLPLSMFSQVVLAPVLG